MADAKGKTATSNETQDAPVEQVQAEKLAASTARGTITDGREYVRATEAETNRVREAFGSDKGIPEGFRVRFAQQGGETVMIVEKAK